MICVAELTVKLVAAALPKLTAVAPVKLVPVMVTDVPPAAGPERRTDLVTVGRVGELIGRRGGRGAARRDHRHVHRARVPAGLVAVICVPRHSP